eukprot:GHVT01024537.1.p1 GENE.GHVT01024537.1~~GHVT01024537.1.p1  ORF type:complete len:314 (-),score=18.13 GHVT01024537.1:2350-3291(-)
MLARGPRKWSPRGRRGHRGGSRSGQAPSRRGQRVHRGDRGGSAHYANSANPGRKGYSLRVSKGHVCDICNNVPSKYKFRCCSWAFCSVECYKAHTVQWIETDEVDPGVPGTSSSGSAPEPISSKSVVTEPPCADLPTQSTVDNSPNDQTSDSAICTSSNIAADSGLTPAVVTKRLLRVLRPCDGPKTVQLPVDGSTDDNKRHNAKGSAIGHEVTPASIERPLDDSDAENDSDDEEPEDVAGGTLTEEKKEMLRQNVKVKQHLWSSSLRETLTAISESPDAISELSCHVSDPTFMALVEDIMASIHEHDSVDEK